MASREICSVVHPARAQPGHREGPGEDQGAVREDDEAEGRKTTAGPHSPTLPEHQRQDGHGAQQSPPGHGLIECKLQAVESLASQTSKMDEDAGNHTSGSDSIDEDAEHIRALETELTELKRKKGRSISARK